MRVEIQIRTVAMDFWASLEHQIQYKSAFPAGQDIRDELLACVNHIAETDQRMLQLRNRIHPTPKNTKDNTHLHNEEEIT